MEINGTWKEGALILFGWVVFMFLVGAFS